MLFRLAGHKTSATHLFQEFWTKAYPVYAKQFSILKAIATHSIFYTKLQKTEIGQGLSYMAL